MWRQIVGLFVDDESEKTRKKARVAFFKVLSHNLPAGTI
jgi:hypothetical protein